MTYLYRASVWALFLFFSGSKSFSQTAYNFSYNGTTYAVTYTLVSPLQNPALFNDTNMPWWGDQTAARAFTLGVGNNLGTVQEYYGPLFAYNYIQTNPAQVVTYRFDTRTTSTVLQGVYPLTYQAYYATATAVPEIDANALPKGLLLLLCLFFIFPRKQRSP